MALRKLALLSLMLLSLHAFGQAVPSQLVESNFPTVDIAILADNNIGGVPQTWGRPRALQTYDAATVLLYAQGLPELNAPLPDEVWLFTNPNTPTGWSTAYTRVKRILPTTSGVGSDVNMNYAHHWPYKMHNRYYMVAQEAATPSTENFHFYLMGKSADGINNWTFRKFFRTREGITLDQLAWKEVSIGGVTYNYGFVSGISNITGISAIRLRQDASAGGEWAYDTSATSTALAVWTASGWVNVPTCASIGDSSGYDFCMYRNPICATSAENCPASAKIDPYMFINNARHPSLHRLERHNGTYELWYHSTQPRPASKPVCGPEDATNPTLDNANAFVYHQFTPPTSLTQDPATLVGPAFVLGEEPVDADRIRCMPAMYRQSRDTPFRLEWTLDMLYSRTKDNKTAPMTGTPVGYPYIVRTRLEVLGSP